MGSTVSVIIKSQGGPEATKDIKGIGDAANAASPHIEKTGKSVEDLGNKAERGHGPISKLGGALGDVAKIAGGFVVAQGLLQLPGLFSGMIGNASDVNESLSKAQTVFGASSKSIEDFASTASTALGMTRGAALETTATFGNLFTAIGLSKPAAADLSKGIVSLGTDLASFNNLPTADVLEKLRAGLVGEAEPLRALGVNINEAMVKTKGLAMGLPMLGKELTEASKVQARYALIMEQTKTAQGDFARTSGGLANETKILKAQFGDLSADIGAKLLPVMVSLTGAMIEGLPAAIGLGEALGEKLQGPLQSIAELVSGTVLPALAELAAITWDALTEAWQIVQPLLVKVAALTWDGLIKLAGASWATMKDAWTVIADKMGGIKWDVLKGAATDSQNWANAWDAVKGKLAPVVELLKPLVQDILREFKEQIAEIGKSLKEDLGPALAELEPALKPIGIVLGTVVVVALWALLEVVKLIIPVLGGALVLAIKATAAEIDVMVKAVAFVAPAFTAAWDVMKPIIEDKIVPAIQKIINVVDDLINGAGGGIGHMMTLAGNAFTSLWNLASEPLGKVWAAIQKILDAAGKLGSAVPGFIKDLFSGGGGDGHANPAFAQPSSGARAMGGPVLAGHAYTVGEGGIETFVPGTDGRIIPNGGGGIVVNMLGPVYANSQAEAAARGNDIAFAIAARGAA